MRESRKPIDSEPKPMPSDKPPSVPLQPVVRCRCTGEHGRIIFRFADNAHVKVRWFNGKVTHEPVSMIEEIHTPNPKLTLDGKEPHT